MPTLLATHMRELSKAIVFPPHHGPLLRSLQRALPPGRGVELRLHADGHGRARARGHRRPLRDDRRVRRGRLAQAQAAHLRAGARSTRASTPRTRCSWATASTSTWQGRRGSAWTRPGSTPSGRRCPRTCSRPTTRFATWPSSGPSSASQRARRASHTEAFSKEAHVATTRKVIIIGSGPAGYTAAIYAARANLSPVMFTGMQSGGQLMLTTLVENYPGLRRRHRRAAADGELRASRRERFGTEMIRGGRDEGGLQPAPVHASARTTRRSKRTPSSSPPAPPRSSSASPSESKLMGRGVSTCATCDGFFFKDQNIMVVGGGDTAMEEALYLSRLGRKVEVVHRRDTLRASKIMQERAFKNPKISFIWDSVVEDVLDPAAGQGHGGTAQEPQDGRPVGDRGRRPLRRHRPPAEHGASSRGRSICTRTSTSR